jgi:hypothetical protein
VEESAVAESGAESLGWNSLSSTPTQRGTYH